MTGRSNSPAESERSRIQQIEAFARDGAVPGFDHIIEAAKADGRSWPDDVAMAILREIQARHASAMGSVHSGSGNVPDLAAVQRAAQREWSSNAAIRAEFNSQAAYVAFKKAEALGSVRIQSRSAAR